MRSICCGAAARQLAKSLCSAATTALSTLSGSLNSRLDLRPGSTGMTPYLRRIRNRDESVRQTGAPQSKRIGARTFIFPLPAQKEFSFQIFRLAYLPHKQRRGYIKRIPFHLRLQSHNIKAVRRAKCFSPDSGFHPED